MPSAAADAADPDLFLSRLYLPIAFRTFLSADEANAEWLRAEYGADIRIIACPPRTVVAAIERRFRAVFSRRATRELVEREPQFSASTVVTRGQAAAFAAVALLAILMLLAAPQWASVALTAMLCSLFLANSAFRALLLWIGGCHRPLTPALSPSDAALPVYSILVPLYREANVMPALLRALRATECLDIKLIVEADDPETAVAADAAAAAYANFSVIRVPTGTPRTKPRACNYAMPFALGEFTVIFDAEDRPEPDQLRKAVATFRAAPDSVACLQARLNFYNAKDGWLAKVLS